MTALPPDVPRCPDRIVLPLGQSRFAALRDGPLVCVDYRDATGTSRTGWCDVLAARAFALALLTITDPDAPR